MRDDGREGGVNAAMLLHCIVNKTASLIARRWIEECIILVMGM